MVTVTTHKPAELSTAELNKLYSLAFKDGRIHDRLYFTKDKPGTRVIVLRDDDNIIRSWGLLCLVKENKFIDTPKRYKYDFMMYTNSRHRRKGYGKMVYTKAMQIAGGHSNMYVHRHDRTSEMFYDHMQHGFLVKHHKRP